MGRAISALLTCSLLALASGCGSSASPSGGATATGGPKATTGLKVNTTPRYASPSPTAPVLSGVIQIAYHNITIAPDVIRVKVGSTVRWTNYDSVEHNVTSRTGHAPFASRNFGEGKSFEVTLTKPGVIRYVCTIHPTSMNGTIEVVR